MSATPQLTTLDLYERWAPSYPPVPHNPLMRAEQRAMLDLWPNAHVNRALDLACGSGRYTTLLARGNNTEVIALDFSAAMLRQVSAGKAVRASMMSLPFVDRAFGLVVSGLAVGHASDIKGWMREIARVLDHDGVLLYSDFHPDAARAGMTRTFKDPAARTHTLPHSHYSVASQKAAAAEAGLTVEGAREVCAGIDLTESFPGSEDFYRTWPGLPLVLVMRARKSR